MSRKILDSNDLDVTRRRHHDLELVSDVFSAAYKAVREHRVMSYERREWVVDDVVEAARAGAMKGLRELVDAALEARERKS